MKKKKIIKEVYRGNSMQDSLAKGVDLIADTVKVTLGAKGQLVGISRAYGVQHLTKDGVSVAREVVSSDPVENFAINVVREASQRTAIEAGDGTTSVLVLTQALYKSGLHAIQNGTNAVELNKELQDFSVRAVEEIKKASKKIKQSDIKKLTQIATISANNDSDIGGKIAEVVSRVGSKGVITVEPSNTLGVQVEYVEGLEIDRGFISPYFINQQKPECVLENPKVLVTSKKITAFTDIMQLIQEVLERDRGMSLVIVAEDVDGEALSNLILNNNNPQIPLKVCVVRAPGIAEQKEELLKDICSVTGAVLIDGNMITEFNTSCLGSAKRFRATREKSLFVAHDDNNETIETRVEYLKEELTSLKTDYDKERMLERLARLSKGIAIIKVGASTDVETLEIRDRLDDAIRATQSALEEGYLPGGGIAYLNLIKLTGIYADELLSPILSPMLSAPLEQILTNAEYSDDEKKLLVKNYVNHIGEGSNVLTREDYINMISEGIIDPAKVVRESIQNSISVVSQLLLTKAVITENEN